MKKFRMVTVITTLAAVTEITNFTMANGSFFMQRAHSVYEWMTSAQPAGLPPGQPPRPRPDQPAESLPEPTGSKTECAGDNPFTRMVCKYKEDLNRLRNKA